MTFSATSAELDAESVGIGPERCQRALQAEERFDLLAQQKCRLDLVAQAAHLGLEPLHILTGVGDPSLRRRLRLDHPLDLFLGHRHLRAQPLEATHLPFDFHATFPKGIELLSSLQDRGERSEIIRGGFGAGDKRLQRHGEMGSARINGDHGVVVASATFQETDHWQTPRESRGSGRH